MNIVQYQTYQTFCSEVIYYEYFLKLSIMNNTILCQFCEQKIEKIQIYFHQKNCEKSQNDEKKAQQQLIKNLEILNQHQQKLSEQIQEQQDGQLQLINAYLDIVQQHEEILKKGEQLFKAAKITKQRFKNQEQQNCKICQKGFNQDNIFILLNCCSSDFHKKCFYDKLRQSTKCFNCKKELFNESF